MQTSETFLRRCKYSTVGLALIYSLSFLEGLLELVCISLCKHKTSFISSIIHRTQKSQSVVPVFFFCRRFIWNFFRLENEHLNNCGEFRAVRDISVMPMDPNDHILLETLMDDETGPPRSSSVLVNGKLTHKRRSTIISNSTLANHTSV